MNFDELKSRDVKELRVLAAKYNIKTHHRAKPETIAKLIVEHIAKPAAQPQTLKHMGELAQKPADVHTEEQVRDVIKNYTSKEGFQALFPGDDTWLFRYKTREEAGHMSCPLRIIRMKAENVSKGPLRPLVVKNSDGQDVMMAGR